MENLQEAYPPQLAFAPLERAPMSTRRTVSIKPSTGTKVSSAGSQDIIQFRLPNTGVLASCYLKGTIKSSAITTGSNATNSFACDHAVADPFAPASSWIRRLSVKASDGTELTNVNNYHRFCSIKARMQNDEGYSENQGSIMEGTASDNLGSKPIGYNSATLTDAAMAAGAASIYGVGGAEYEHKRLRQGVGVVAGNTFIHEFQTGILAADKNKDYFLPLALLGSGLTCELTCADVGEVFRVVKNASTVFSAASLDQHPAVAADIASYDLTDLELVCDLLFLEPALMSSLASEMCGGLKIVCDSVRQQQNAVPQESNTIILNQHARSVKAVFCGVKNAGDANNVRRDEAEYYKTPATGGSSVSKFQFSIGAESAPATPIVYGAQSYKELEKAMKAVVGDEFKMGNQIRKSDYEKVHRTDAAGAGTGGAGVRPGSALFGINLQRHPEMPSVISGRSASAGSISMSLDLEFSGSTNLSSAVLETFIVSDQVIELLADGGALVSK
tara:strand:- start:1297 stop:2802 length:1506 start_codon:yes stop_codon:yes gene_type:complete